MFFNNIGISATCTAIGWLLLRLLERLDIAPGVAEFFAIFTAVLFGVYIIVTLLSSSDDDEEESNGPTIS